MKVTLVFILASLMSLSSAVVRYDNYTLYKLSPKTVYELEILQILQKSSEYKLDFWKDTHILGIPIKVLVSPLDKYNFEEINSWLKKLANDYPDTVNLIKGGTSFEKRDILGVKVSFGKQKGRRSVWLDSQMHAREWISGATTTFILNEILNSKEPAVRAIAESHDWYIFPVINPDGYEYSHTTDRLWRKTRSDYGQSCKETKERSKEEANYDPCPGPAAFSVVETNSLSEHMSKVADSPVINPDEYEYSHTTDRLWRKTSIDYNQSCKGTDPNRNWGYKWNEERVNNDPCSTLYPGPAAFSEIETRSLSEYMSKVADEILVFITFHSHGQLILLPYGHTPQHLDNYDEAYSVAAKAAESLAVRYGTQYNIGNIAETSLGKFIDIYWYIQSKNFDTTFFLKHDMKIITIITLLYKVLTLYNVDQLSWLLPLSRSSPCSKREFVRLIKNCVTSETFFGWC
ncbi:unnamed protein product [Diabrotica balteata]|uniref:Peptidase M14 domain-containing protein n=1 Tax=Diabrotica balteata TaxID=107213 RepID=A0A9N9XBQ0_DIABA|nr:unnamed protein product [Diabrotica balteata]